MFYTANPCADSERWENEQAERASRHEDLQVKAYDAVLRDLQALTPEQWSMHAGDALQFPADEILCDALESDDDTISAFAELMTSPAALDVLKAMASHHARRHFLNIATN